MFLFLDDCVAFLKQVGCLYEHVQDTAGERQGPCRMSVLTLCQGGDWDLPDRLFRCDSITNDFTGFQRLCKATFIEHIVRHLKTSEGMSESLSQNSTRVQSESMKPI